ncbi:MAG: site-specific integrase, partial [Vicingaceae bacterium]
MRRKRTDGTYPIVFRITYEGSSRAISTGFTARAVDWDIKNNDVIVTSKSTQLLYERLKEQRLKHQEKLMGFERKMMDTTTDVQTVKDYLTGKLNHQSTVKGFWEEEIKRLNHIRNYANSRNYKSALGGVLKEMPLNIPFSRIDYRWLLQLESKLLAKGIKVNSVGVYMRTLRAIYNKAININLVEPQYYPFRGYKIKTEATAPRVASIEELHQFFELSPAVERLYEAWCYGRLIFLLRGINFTDLALLTKKNLKHGRIVYKRAKTHKMYSAKLLPLTEKIIYNYMDDDRETLLPILSNQDLKSISKLPKRIGQQ